MKQQSTTAQLLQSGRPTPRWAVMTAITLIPAIITLIWTALYGQTPMPISEGQLTETLATIALLAMPLFVGGAGYMTKKDPRLAKAEQALERAMTIIGNHDPGLDQEAALFGEE